MTNSHNFDIDYVFDLLRGIAVYTESRLIGDMARTVSEFPEAELSVAFNHKQMASKIWLKDKLFETLGGAHRHIWILGGWYGVLSAMLFEDPRFSIQKITSIDLDPACAPVALSLNQKPVAADRFKAITMPMESLVYDCDDAPSLVINTSCEHVNNLALALKPIPAGTKLILQSNNYRRELDHVSCVDSLGEFEQQARLGKKMYHGELKAKNYTRFMLIGEK